MRQLLVSVLFLGLISIIGGCNKGPKEEQIAIKVTDPLAPVKTAFQRYANGEPLGSEVTGFDNLVAELKKSDPTKADVAAKGFADIQKTPNNRSAIAKEVLQKLQ